MKPKSLKIKFSREATAYKIVVGSGLIAESGAWARKCLGKGAARIVIVSNHRVFEFYGKAAEESLGAEGFVVSHFLIKDGEQHKTFRTAESALKFFAEAGMSRTDAVIALGGGVVGDLAGFAAAIYLRGIPFLQIPTTLLAMIDSSVGGKTGVNSAFGKNLIGAFHQPSGVLVDTDTLSTLPERDLRAGFCEVIKHGAIGGRSLLKQIDDFLAICRAREKSPNPRNLKSEISNLKSETSNLKFEISNFKSEISDLILANVEFKAKIVAGDDLESSKRLDNRSRKILNFGHTLAHALEKVTDYKYFRHGEAVGYGILFAAELSKTLALCDEKDVKLLNDVLHRVGVLPSLANIGADEVFEAFRFDKKHLAGSLQMVLLKGIGKPVIVDERDIPRSSTQKVLKNLLQKWA